MYGDQLFGGKWVKYPANPLLIRGRPGDFDYFNIHAPMVVYYDNQYWMFYSGGPCGPPGYEYVDYQLSLATSRDGINFRKIGRPILSLGERDNFHTCMAVLRDAKGEILLEDGVWKAWFNGNRRNDLEMATSVDGIHWEKHSSSPVTTGAYSPTILRDDGLYRMWYTVGSYGAFDISYAESHDGIHWIHRDKPVLTRGDGWDSYNVLYPHVLRIDYLYYMFYTGMTPGRCSIGIAASKDGIAWERQVFSIIEPGPEEWDCVYSSCASVVHAPEGKWRIYYAGRKDTIHKYHAIGMAEL